MAPEDERPVGPPDQLQPAAGPCSIIEPAEQTIPLVFASPHSGQQYPPAFVSGSRLHPVMLRRSEDAFVDRIFAAAPRFGAPLLRAHFPRAYVDPNREPFELDPAMFADRLPDYVNVRSPRVAAGLGTIARVVANGEEIYRDKLSFAEALERIEAHYFPYHRALQHLLDATRARFGCYLLIDCHSMPSIGGPMDADPGLRRLDIVLGDCYGTSCAPQITALAESVLKGQGLTVRRNVPYAGGYTTRHYGRPADGMHTLQIEVNRCLYLDEERIMPSPQMAHVCEIMTGLIEALATLDRKLLTVA